jgi:hypothetical protein
MGVHESSAMLTLFGVQSHLEYNAVVEGFIVLITLYPRIELTLVQFVALMHNLSDNNVPYEQF